MTRKNAGFSYLLGDPPVTHMVQRLSLGPDGGLSKGARRWVEGEGGGAGGEEGGEVQVWTKGGQDEARRRREKYSINYIYLQFLFVHACLTILQHFYAAGPRTNFCHLLEALDVFIFYFLYISNFS